MRSLLNEGVYIEGNEHYFSEKKKKERIILHNLVVLSQINKQ